MIKSIIIDHFMSPLILVICRIMFRIRFIGAENIPSDGPVILAPNHVSYADPFWVTLPVQRRLRYMAWDRIFQFPLIGQFVRFLGAFPVKLERFDRCAIQSAREVLRQGEAVVIFPEGGRSRDGHLMTFKPGVSRLAVTTGTTIVPVTINGGFEAWPPHHALPRPHKITITYHSPIKVEQISSDAESAEVRAAAIDLSQQIREVVASALNAQTLADQNVSRRQSEARS